jgi:hypothetical protein
MLHQRHHLEKILANHDEIRDAMDRIDLLTEEQILDIAVQVQGKEIGSTSLEKEPRGKKM